MSKKKTVTNAMRILSAEKIEFQSIEYDGEKILLEDNFGIRISELTGIEPEKSYKTLVGRGDKTGVLVCCIPVAKECDLKKLAQVSGNKKVELIHVKDLLALTGYIRGSVSPIGMKKKYPTYIDSTCQYFDKIAISAGVCGCTLLLSPEDVIKVTCAKTENIIKGDK